MHTFSRLGIGTLLGLVLIGYQGYSQRGFLIASVSYSPSDTALSRVKLLAINTNDPTDSMSVICPCPCPIQPCTPCFLPLTIGDWKSYFLLRTGETFGWNDQTPGPCMDTLFVGSIAETFSIAANERISRNVHLIIP